MATAQSTRDLRSHAIESKRVQDHNTKWDPAYSRYCPLVLHDKKHPPRAGPSAIASERRRKDCAKQVGAKNSLQKLDRLGTDDEAEPLDKLDTEGAFDGTPRSYDSCEGPTAGQQLLGIAMNKAIARYEDKQTTKLVKDEYDVLDANDSDKNDDAGHGCVDDDFELL